MSSNQHQLWQHIYHAVGLEPPATENRPTVQPGPRPILFEESAVSSLELHHHIDANYPSVFLCKDQSETIILNKRFNAEQRHPPFPLIQDDDVYDHAGRDRSYENSFSSMYRATSMKLKECQFTHTDLVHDVTEATKCHGYTKLGAVLIRIDGGPPQIRIGRKTYYRHYDDPQYDSHNYQMSLESFLSLGITARWYQDLVHLIGITDDRAARHVRIKLERAADPSIHKPETVELLGKFMASFGKPERRADYEPFLKEVGTKEKRTSLFSKTKICVGCNKPVGSKHPGVALPCPEKHVVGRECLLQRLFRPSTDPARSCCPTCRFNLFTDPEMLAEMKYGVINGIYENDFRFTQWENFERSCADLDISEARKNDFRITVNPELIIGIWYKMVFNGMEPGTLQHLKPVLAPEFKILEQTFITHIQRLDGVSTTISNLDRWLKMQVFKEFHTRWLAAGLDSTLGWQDRGKWFNEEEILRKLLPVGFADFLCRVLNRTLQFQSLRVCSCPAGQGEEFHKHGGREFYDPENVSDLETQARKEMFLWQRGKNGRAYLKGFAADENQAECAAWEVGEGGFLVVIR